MIGDTVNTAQRIESKAGRGQSFISEDTFRQIERSVAAVKLPAVEVKNKSGTVQMYSVRAVTPPTGYAGVLASVPTQVIEGDRIAEGLFVWAKQDGNRLVLELCADRAPKEFAQIEINLRVQEKPELPTLSGIVVASHKVEGPGSALVAIENPPPETLALFTPGTVVAAGITAEEVVRR